METRRLFNLAGWLVCLTLIGKSMQTLAGNPDDNMKHILIWGDPTLYPSSALGDGSSAFIENKCVYRNCYVTSNKKLKDITDFDAIIFNGRILDSYVPEKRSEKQKYVYANTESSHYYPICDNVYNDFFNWTWTYKLKSDALWGYMRVYDLNRTIVGPKIDMHWSDLGPVDDKTKFQIRHKTVAAAWFVSNCNGPSKRIDFVKTTSKELEKYGHSIHVYGKCGDYSCPRSMSEKCNKKIADDYFFYFAFENSFDEDYVTEKVLTGLQNYAVPVVFGAANYSRFLPPGSYLDARQLGPESLASRMASIIKSYRQGQPEDYYDFFRWRSRYFIESMHADEFVCRACADLNNPDMMSTRTVYPNITRWWNSEYATCHGQIVKQSFMVLLVGLVLVY